MIRLSKKYIRKDIETYKPKFKLLLPLCKFEVKRFNSNNKEII